MPEGRNPGLQPGVWLHFALGENDLGFDWMEMALEGKDPRLYKLKVEPFLDGVRSDPRYIELLGKVGFE